MGIGQVHPWYSGRVSEGKAMQEPHGRKGGDTRERLLDVA
jgi:hypothetical protein